MNETASEQKDRQRLFSEITRHFNDLKRFVRHQLAYLESVGDLNQGELNVDEVVDAVVLRAYREFSTGASGKEIPSWLKRLAAEQLAADERAPLPVPLDLWAPGWGPCRMLAPAVEEVANEMGGQLRVAKLNIGENPATAASFHVQSVPTLLVLKGCHGIERIVGAQPKAEITRRLQRAFT